MLDAIIASSHNPAPDTGMTGQGGTLPPSPPNGVDPAPGNTPPAPKPPKQRASAGTIFKMIGSLILVSIIFFGAFLTYIVFNPGNAAFFINIFGIDPEDVAILLKNLINISFGIIFGILAIVWVISLFRAIWTPKEQKRKRFLNTMSAILIGILLFSIVSLWAFLFQMIARTDYANLSGSVLIYDNDLYTHSDTQSISKIDRFSNLIGPITLRFDISRNAIQVQNKNVVQITDYQMNFQGAQCNNGSSIINGNDATREQSIICTFNEIRPYNIRGTYTIQTRTGETETIDIPLPVIEIKGIMQTNTTQNREGKNVITLDASALQTLGTPRWTYLESNSNQTIEENRITEIPSDTPIFIGLQVYNNPGPFWGYDRVFVIHDRGNTGNDGELLVEKSGTHPQEYTLTLTGIAQSENEILNIQWRLNDSEVICPNNRQSLSCVYRFRGYGEWNIRANLDTVSGENILISKAFTIKPALEVERHLRVLDRTGKMLNPASTLDRQTQQFIIRDILVPETITLDARDVITTNAGFNLKNVTWTINDGRNTETRVGDRIEYAITRTARYSITAKYEFQSTLGDETQEAQDVVILDLERKNLTPILQIDQTSDYVPAKVTVDGSQSRAEYSDIIKFIYDFGEGRPQTEGDAIQTYEYMTPGDKTITLTIVDSNGERASTKEVVVLKETPNVIGFTTSLSPGFVGVNVDFIANGTTGQIEEYIWNFGDNTPVGRGYEVTHKYNRAGTYDVSLTVRYTNGTERTTTQKFVVEQSMD